jgi:hypothetical protein
METPVEGSDARIERGVAPRICDVITAWRAAARELAELAATSPDRDRLHADLVGLRALHHHLFDQCLSEWPRGRIAATRLPFNLMAWTPAPPPALVTA